MLKRRRRASDSGWGLGVGVIKLPYTFRVVKLLHTRESTDTLDRSRLFEWREIFRVYL
jgi:hypothetical protein